jgi:hypothetical protein
MLGAHKRNLSQITALVKTRLRRMQFRLGLHDGFLASTRLDLTPFCNPPLEIFSRAQLPTLASAQIQTICMRMC